MEKRPEDRDEVSNLKLGTKTRRQPSRKAGKTFSVTFALTDVEDNLVEQMAERTGSRSRSIEVRQAIHERSQRILKENPFLGNTQ